MYFWYLMMTLFTGFGCGVIFSISKMPIPAPLSFSGVVGILGIYLGYSFVRGEWI
jgi:XapX domain-containing protein